MLKHCCLFVCSVAPSGPQAAPASGGCSTGSTPGGCSTGSKVPEPDSGDKVLVASDAETVELGQEPPAKKRPTSCQVLMASDAEQEQEEVEGEGTE